MFLFLSVSLILTVVQAVEFEFVNKEDGAVWVGIQGNPGNEHLANGGFVLGAGQSRTINSAPNWQGRFWGRTWCDGGTNHCLTGDCGNKLECAGAGGVPPVSLAEITLKGEGGKDFYDISFVDGFNLPLSFEPVGGQSDGTQYSCKPANCKVNLNDGCPSELQLKSDHGVIACKSACLAFNTDEYCCRGAHNTEPTCKSTDWPKNYPKYFKDKCPDGYSYAFDDHKSLFSCKSEKYIITFGV